MELKCKVFTVRVRSHKEEVRGFMSYDIISMRTDIPCADSRLSNGFTVIEFHAGYGEGVDYLKKAFGLTDEQIIVVPEGAYEGTNPTNQG